MKKFISVLIAVIILVSALSFSASAAQPTLSATASGNAKTGTTFKVDVSLQNNPALSGVCVTAKYDRTVLALESVKNGDVFKAVKSKSSQTTMPYEVVLATSDGKNSTKNGKLLTYTFKVLDSAVLGNTKLYFDITDYISSGTTPDIDFVKGDVTVNIEKGSAPSSEKIIPYPSSDLVAKNSSVSQTSDKNSSKSGESENTATVSENASSNSKETTNVLTESDTDISMSSAQNTTAENSSENYVNSEETTQNSVDLSTDPISLIYIVIIMAVLALVVAIVTVIKKKKV